MVRKTSSKPADSTANLGFEAKLWRAADKLRNNMDAAEPERSGDSQPQTARRVSVANQYFLTQFASAEGKNGGQFYTPSCVVRLLVEMLAPYTALRGSAFLQSEASPQVVSAAKDNGRIYDPACGSGGVAKCEVRIVSVEVKKSRPFVIRNSSFGISLGPEHADTFRRDLHPDLRADFVIANPPFNDSDWFRKDDDVRWQFGVPPKGNANFAWVQHFIHHLAPQGMAGFVLANGSMSSNQSGEGEIRKALIEADLVDCMVALPGQLFASTEKLSVALAA